MAAHGKRGVLRFASVAGALLVAVSATRSPNAQEKEEPKDTKRPSLAIRATPNVSFAPARVSFTVDLKGGPNDYEEFYCAGVEWEWGDGTSSESSNDCEPYEAGKSEIKRRHFIQHVYQTAGNYRVNFKLKRKDKVLTVTNVSVTVRPGLYDPPY
jgi:hypothetical protein